MDCLVRTLKSAMRPKNLDFGGLEPFIAYKNDSKVQYTKACNGVKQIYDDCFIVDLKKYALEGGEVVNRAVHKELINRYNDTKYRVETFQLCNLAERDAYLSNTLSYFCGVDISEVNKVEDGVEIELFLKLEVASLVGDDTVNVYKQLNLKVSSIEEEREVIKKSVIDNYNEFLKDYV